LEILLSSLDSQRHPQLRCIPINVVDIGVITKHFCDLGNDSSYLEIAVGDFKKIDSTFLWPLLALCTTPVSLARDNNQKIIIPKA
jgi:hypothetical protein